jgi:hypothetical protein
MVINSEQCLSLALGDYEKDLIYRENGDPPWNCCLNTPSPR